VLLESDQRAYAPRSLPSQPGTSGAILASSRGNNSASLTVDARRSSWLEIPESWDPGWSATVNGRPARVYRVDYQQRGILIPSGRSIVRLRYQPPGWNDGVAIAIITALGLLGGIAVPWVRKRRGATA
jgi:uncharacterized membrane protein YfhO